MPFLNKLSCFCLILFSLNAYSQEKESELHEEFNHHSVSILISHTIITEGIKDGKRSTISVPSWALNYNYRFNEKWSIGWHNDIIIEDFVIEKNSGNEIIERSVPVAALIVGTYKFTKSFGIEIGGGMEFEKNENFGVARIGAEYGIEIPSKNLEVLFAIDYDILFDAYNSFNFGIGIAKLF